MKYGVLQPRHARGARRKPRRNWPSLPWHTILRAQFGRRRRARGRSRPGRMEIMKSRLVAACGAVALLVGGCVQQPAGPTVAVMPAPYKPFEVFQQDQATCMQYGNQMVAG